MRVAARVQLRYSHILSSISAKSAYIHLLLSDDNATAAQEISSTSREEVDFCASQGCASEAPELKW